MEEWYAIDASEDNYELIARYFKDHDIDYEPSGMGRNEIHFEFYASPEEAEEFSTYMKGKINKMDNNKNLKELMAGIGSICEIVGLLRDELIRCGFTRKEAIYIVSSYTSKLLLPPANRPKGD